MQKQFWGENLPYDEVKGRLFHYGIVKVTLDSSGNGTKKVIFDPEFIGTPEVTIIEPKSDLTGTYNTSGTLDKSEMTINVASSEIVSQDIEIGYQATEKI